MTAPTFGVDQLCRCKGQRPDCPWCHGEGLRRGPQAPVRRDSPETSISAAASLSPERLTRYQKDVLSTIRFYGPLTDERLVELFDGTMSPSGVRTRRSELCGKGLVEPAGTAVLKSGHRGTLWTASRPLSPTTEGAE